MQLAIKFSPCDIRYPVSVEPKIDGWRCFITVHPVTGAITARGRQGAHLKPRLRHITRTLLAAVRRHGYTAPVSFDGELQASSWGETQSILKSRGAGPRDVLLTFHVFDMLVDVMAVFALAQRYSGRRARLVHVLGKCRNKRIRVVDSEIVRNQKELKRAFGCELHLGNEGLIIKKLDDVYGSADGWMKMKEVIDVTGTVRALAAQLAIIKLCERDGGRAVQVKQGAWNLSVGDTVECDAIRGTHFIRRRLSRGPQQPA